LVLGIRPAGRSSHLAAPKGDQDHHISASPTVPHILAALGVFTKRIIPGVSAFKANTFGTQPL